jgi:hypothetical protein
MNELSKKFSDDLHAFLSDKLGELLIQASKEFSENAAAWEMPMVQDFVLVAAVQDLKDADGTVAIFTSRGTPDYRIRGLLHEALGQ